MDRSSVSATTPTWRCCALKASISPRVKRFRNRGTSLPARPGQRVGFVGGEGSLQKAWCPGRASATATLSAALGGHRRDINEGNSGGPVFRDGVVIGIAFPTLMMPRTSWKSSRVPSSGGSSRRSSRAVPRDPRSVHPDPAIGKQSPASKCGFDRQESGILVTAVELDGATWGVLQPGDVLMEVDGHRVGNNDVDTRATFARALTWFCLRNSWATASLLACAMEKPKWPPLN